MFSRCHIWPLRINGTSNKAQPTHPNVAVLVVRLPVPARVAVQEPVARRPVGAAVAALRGHGAHLFPGTQVHLEPLVVVAIQGGPPTRTCGANVRCEFSPSTK